MKTKYAVALALLAGVAIGGVSVGGLYAQGKEPGAYVIVTFTEISDMQGFMDNVAAKAPGAMKPYTGRLLARANEDAMTKLRPGAPPFPIKRFALLAFDDMEKATAWYNSPENKPINEWQEAHTKGRIVALKAGM
jgi:uncharacterized protein (DUF1330 family)